MVETIADRLTDAWARTDRIFELQPDLQEWARTDKDLDKVRDDPEMRAILV